MGRGFAPKQRRFCLRIQAESATFPIKFWVIDEGKWPSIARAKRTAIALFAIVQYGTEADGFTAICEEFGSEYIDQLLAVHDQIKGQRFLGKLRGADNKLIINCASHPGMIGDERAYNSEQAIAELTA